MNNELENKKIAILMTDGFEEVEYTEPRKALDEAGATSHVIALKSGKVKAWNSDKWGGEYDVDKTVDSANADDYDGLFLPGGVLNPDQLRMNKKAVEFATNFFKQKKPIAAICHGPQILIETGALKGRRMTSYPSIKTDLINAGVDWVDEEVVVDEGLTTSRKPDDIPAFINKMVEEFAEGKHAMQNTLEA